MHDRLRTDRSEQRTVVATLAAAVGAWAALVALSWRGGPALHGHGSSSAAVAPAAFTTLWLLMVAAMMLPPSMLFVRTLNRLVAQRVDGRRIVAAALIGYSLAWVVTGQAFQVGDGLVHELVDGSVWLTSRRHVVAATVLVLAGLYQFAPLKLRCLRGCRSPQGFVARGWGGRAPLADAFRIGATYGWSCVGCCWALMLLMFAAGLSSLWLMALLTAVMVVERRVRRVEFAVSVLGGGLILGGFLMAIEALPGLA